MWNRRPPRFLLISAVSRSSRVISGPSVLQFAGTPPETPRWPWLILAKLGKLLGPEQKGASTKNDYRFLPGQRPMISAPA